MHSSSTTSTISHEDLNITIPSSSRNNNISKKGKRTKDTNIYNHLPTPGGNVIDHPLLAWDCTDVEFVPIVDKIKKLHIYDFDNTIFKSPCPNPNLYSDSTIGILSGSEQMNGGGWWSNPLTLKNVGEGWDIESRRKWEGFWNEDIIELIKHSNEDDEVLTIIMTGRKKIFFTELISELLEAKGIHYDGLILKQGDFKDTLSFKTQVITDLLSYYDKITSVAIYDDRRSQLNGFQTCLNEYAEAVREDLTYSLIPVFTSPSYLDPKVERQLVEEYVDSHNRLVANGKSRSVQGIVSFRKSIFGSAYILKNDSRALLIDWVIKAFPHVFNTAILSGVRFEAKSISISKNKLSRTQDKYLTSLETTFKWKVKSFGFKNELYAVQVEQVDESIDLPTLVKPALVPIASHGKSHDAPAEDFNIIDEWLPVKEDIIIETTYGHVVSFKLVADGAPKRANRKRKALNAPTSTLE